MTMTPERLEGIDSTDRPPEAAEVPVVASATEPTRRALFRAVLHVAQPELPLENTPEPLVTVPEQIAEPVDKEQIPDAGRYREISRRRALRTFGKVALVAAWVVGGTVAAEKVDQFVGDKIWPSTKPKTHELLPEKPLNSEQLRHGTFVFGGFNTKNATKIAAALKTSLSSNGRLFGIEYDNKGIQLDELVDAVEAEIAEKGLEEISAYGHSMGGDVALMVFAELLKRRPNLVIRNIMLDCTPTGFPAVRAKNKGLGSFFANLKIRGGPGIRMLIELWNSPNRHTFLSPATPLVNTRAILDRMVVIKNEKFNSYSVSNDLAADQLNVIEAIDVPNILEYLGRATEQQAVPPEVMLLRPRNGAQDAMVDVDISEQVLRDAGAASGVRVSTGLLEGKEIHHADPVASADAYNAQIVGMLQSQAESRKMQLAAMAELWAAENQAALQTLGAGRNRLAPK